MVGLTLINGQHQHTVTVESFYTENKANKLVLVFDNDNEARDKEEFLKRNNFKTKHCNNVIEVLEYANINLHVN